MFCASSSLPLWECNNYLLLQINTKWSTLAGPASCSSFVIAFCPPYTHHPTFIPGNKQTFIHLLCKELFPLHFMWSIKMYICIYMGSKDQYKVWEEKRCWDIMFLFWNFKLDLDPNVCRIRWIINLKIGPALGIKFRQYWESKMSKFPS